ncbi:MAG: hypothetical protein ACTS2F_01505 [Thainema sp.]
MVDHQYFAIGSSALDALSAIADQIAQMKLVLCGDSSKGALEGCSCLSIDPTYTGALSVGQRQLLDLRK